MMDKKAQGMSLGFVIVATIGLILLVIIAVIISRNFEGFAQDTDNVRGEFGPNSCEIPGSGRECISGSICPSGSVHQPRYDLSCNPNDEINNICCEQS